MGEVGEGDVGRSLADHQVDGDQALEDRRPGRVVNTFLQGAEDLADAKLAGMGGDEDVLNVFRFWRRKLQDKIRVSQRTTGVSAQSSPKPTLTLVAPLTDFSKELAMADGCRCQGERKDAAAGNRKRRNREETIDDRRRDETGRRE